MTDRSNTYSAPRPTGSTAFALENATLKEQIKELVGVVGDLFPLAKIGVEFLDDRMVGQLYPAINHSKLNKAREVLDQHERIQT